MTSLPDDYTTAVEISTHTLTWSVTFNDSVRVMREMISTHTLTWSVTWHFYFIGGGIMNFNSHAHVERDVMVK